MASIRPIKNKEGEITSYQITVSAGRVGGKQVRKYKTWTPAPGMTARQIEKALNKEAVQFEEAVQKGYSVGGNQTFGDYAQYVIGLKERGGAKHNTIREYHHLMKRIVPAIGHIKLDKLRPQHLNAFYRNLEEQGVADVPDRATAKPDIREKVSTTQKALAVASGLSVNTVALALQGKRVSLSTAQAIAAALGRRVEELFTVDKRQEKLSSKTVLEYHRFISAVLAQAEKEMLVTYNAAQKATPPKLERKEADYFQPEEVEQIRDALEGEPVKWRAVTHLLLITGVRRGELCGLRWDRIDWENHQIKIDRTILYSPDRGIYESSTKTGNVRFIKLPQETMELLREYRVWYNEQRLLNGDRWRESGFVFVKETGGPMMPDSVNAWLNKFSKRKGLPPIHPHKFRHTMASLLYFSHADSVSISKRLGHARVSTTTDIYSHLIAQADEAASECIADAVLRKKA